MMEKKLVKRNMDPRHARRIYTIQKLFERHFPVASTKTQTVDVEGYYGIEQLDKDLLKQAQEDIEGIESHEKSIDRTIEELAPEWPLDQVVRTDLEILRLGIYEGFIIKRVPPRVAINEAIELSREFGGETSRKFVSGVLGSLYEKQEKIKL